MHGFPFSPRLHGEISVRDSAAQPHFSPCLRVSVVDVDFCFSHAFAYFQLTYAAWFISTSSPSRPSRKPPRKKYAQINRTIGRKTMFTTLNPTLRSRATMSAPSDEYRLACSIKLSSVG